MLGRAPLTDARNSERSTQSRVGQSLADHPVEGGTLETGTPAAGRAAAAHLPDQNECWAVVEDEEHFGGDPQPRLSRIPLGHRKRNKKSTATC